MNGNIINNSQNTIQVYTIKTSGTDNVAPDLADYYYRVAVVGSGKSAVIPIVGEGENVYVGVWPSASTNGPPNSWFIISGDTITTDDFVGYKALVTVDSGRYIITINDSTGPQTVITSSTSNIGVYILIASIVLLMLIVIGFMIKYLLQRRRQNGAGGNVGFSDIPLL